MHKIKWSVPELKAKSRVERKEEKEEEEEEEEEDKGNQVIL